MSTPRFVLATLVSIVFCTSPMLAGDPFQSEPDSRVTYYVQAVFKASGRPQKSESYPTPERAFEEVEKWKFDHGPEGSNKFNPIIEGPVVYREYNGKSEPLKPEPSDPKNPQSRPGAIISVDGKPLDLFQGVKDKMAAERKGDPLGAAAATPSIAGKKATGVIGKYKVTMEFLGTGNQGEVVISGDATGKGKWTQDGATLTMETSTKTYRAKIENNEIKGFQFQKDADTGAVDWNVRIQETPSKPKEDASSGPYRSWLWQDNHRTQIWDQTFPTAEEAIEEARTSWDGWKKGNGEVKGTVVTDSKGRVIAKFGQGR